MTTDAYMNPAEAEYAEALGEMQVLIAKVSAATERHVERQRLTPESWTHGGDMRRAVDALRDVLAAIEPEAA